MSPLVSIIIPVYNGADYMREAIDSALNQTYSNVEVVVVNDGSNDNGKTRSIALSYGERIRYFEQDINRGVSSALNIGIRNMRGEYFSRLSHDDIYYPDKIRMEIEALEADGDSNLPVYSGWEILKMPERKIIPCNIINSYEKKYITSGLCAITLGLVAGPSLLIPKSYFDRYGLFDTNLVAVQDYKKYFEMFHDKRMIYVDRVLVQMRSHPDQVTNTYDKFKIECEDLHHWMMQMITLTDTMQVGMDLYAFYSGMLFRMQYADLTKAMNYISERILELPEPVDIDEQISEFVSWLKCVGGTSICLMCMGRHGQKWLKSLLARDIHIEHIADSDSSKWGRQFEGIVCEDPLKLPLDALIIVTRTQPKEIFDYMLSKGYKHVISYEDIEAKLFNVPLKKKHLALFTS